MFPMPPQPSATEPVDTDLNPGSESPTLFVSRNSSRIPSEISEDQTTNQESEQKAASTAAPPPRTVIMANVPFNEPLFLHNDTKDYYILRCDFCKEETFKLSGADTEKSFGDHLLIHAYLPSKIRH